MTSIRSILSGVVRKVEENQQFLDFAMGWHCDAYKGRITGIFSAFHVLAVSLGELLMPPPPNSVA